MKEALLIISFIAMAIAAFLIRNRYTLLNSTKETEDGVSIEGLLPFFHINLNREDIERILVYDIGIRTIFSRRHRAFNCLSAYSIKKGGKAALIITKNDRPVATNFTNIEALIHSLPKTMVTDETET